MAMIKQYVHQQVLYSKNFGGKKFGKMMFLKHWQKTLVTQIMEGLPAYFSA